MKMMTCVHCDGDFDLHSQAKRAAGGRANECADCADETEVKYLGVRNADGKQAGVEVLKFNTNEERTAFNKFWKQASGMHKGKVCPLNDKPRLQAFTFVKVAETSANGNHKGRM